MPQGQERLGRRPSPSPCHNEVVALSGFKGPALHNVVSGFINDQRPSKVTANTMKEAPWRQICDGWGMIMVGWEESVERRLAKEVKVSEANVQAPEATVLHALVCAHSCAIIRIHAPLATG